MFDIFNAIDITPIIPSNSPMPFSIGIIPSKISM